MNHSSFLRVYELDRWVQQGKLKSAEQASEEFEVSARTIERDLDELRGLGADLYYNREKKCYGYKGNPVTLPAQWMNAKEFAILLIAEKALRNHAGLSFYNEIHPVFNKLLRPIRHDDSLLTEIRELCRSVMFHKPYTTDRNVSREFGRVVQAIMAKQRINFCYKASVGKLTRRDVDPYVLVNDGGDWYLIGYCKMRDSIRTFALDRIYNTRYVDHYFAIPKDFKAEEYLDQGFGRMRGKVTTDIVLHISGNAISWIERNKWHASQKIEKKKDGSIVLSMKCPVTDSLARWVVQMGGDVRIQSPEDLKRAAKDHCRKLIENN